MYYDHDSKKYYFETGEEIKSFEIFNAQRIKKVKKLVQCWNGIKDRCNNPNSHSYKYYGGRGIKCIFTYGQLLNLWIRDKAHLLKKQSIDRIDPNGHYEYKNCRFIELSENSRRAHLGVKRKVKVA